MFAEIQDRFAEALLDPEHPVPAAVTSHTARAPQKRFAVYRNNVVVSLVDALARRFPATQRIVGEEFFRAMARLFVTAHPPRSPILMFYGDELPDFIAGFEPARELVYLADVARLEAARTRAYHAADANPVDAGELAAAVGEAALETLRIVPHPSAQLVRSPHPVVTIWAMNADQRPLGTIEEWTGENALVIRPASEVQVCLLRPGGGAFFSALVAGKTFGIAAAAALEDNGTFDLVANLGDLVRWGAIAGLLHPAQTGKGTA